MPTIAGCLDLTVIGHGASATVYRALQKEYSRTVAVKVLHVDVSDRRAQRRFAREREINGRLSHHPNVVTILDSGFVDNRYPYLVMEYHEHGSLAQRLASRGPFPVFEALHVAIRVAGALESAHRMAILHRDVKPQNILLSRFGEPALADFGIATILEMEHSMTAALTPVHAAPELLEDGDPSPRTDVYALASTIYTLLAGSPPFAGPPGEGMLAQLLRITTMDLPAMARTDVPASLFTALRVGTAKRPEERTPTAADFGRVLQSVQAELGLEKTALPLEVSGDAASWPPPRPSGPAALDVTTLAGEPTPPAPAAAAPIPEAPSSPTPLAVSADHTIGHRPDTPTVAARQVQPPPAPAAKRSRRWPIVVGAAIGAVAVGGIGTAVVTRDPDIDETVEPPRTQAAPAPIPVAVPDSTPPPTEPTETTGAAVVVAAPPSTSPDSADHPVPMPPSDDSSRTPTNVKVLIVGDAYEVTWDDNTGGSRPHAVYAFRPEPLERIVVTVDAGGSSRVIRQLDPDEPVCFVVGAILDLDEGSQPGREMRSEPFCVNDARAVPEPADSTPTESTVT